ncbi:L,D-transpeptidase family protein [Fulvivirga sediminis]|uniref:L,D-transpeptidase family protein n=1 Tax=Fulvivirga sediminis TaxID=2803949 RepID=A0A937K0C4_9BACT|nr:L,D-transpeptidase family protein [Fulvivirga sediminis]MBL3656171.1 L,D-transpeptidase family protein [Fulvivirga sediminis]
MKNMFILLFVFAAVNNLLAETIEPSEEIRRWIEDKSFTIDGETIFSKKSIPDFYLDRGFEPAWDNDDSIAELLEQIKLVHQDGLNPEDYHLTYLLEHVKNVSSVTPMLDIMLTDAYFLLTTHLLMGKVNASTIDPEWKSSNKEIELKKTLTHALEEVEVAKSINNVKPKYETYLKLKQALAEYEQMKSKEPWPLINSGETLKPGDNDDRILQLRARLSFTNYYETPEAPDSTLRIYDEALASAVKEFQKRNGLAPDGALGKGTIGALNETLDNKIKKTTINLERCRWLPTDLGKEHLIVNIASFQLHAVKDGKTMLTMNVVVGKPYRKTPVFSEKLRYLVFNPYWTVPPTILSKDILPSVRKNSNYLNNLNIKVVSGETVIDPSTINWATTTASNFPYQLRQDPGPNNALGIVKFIFPNPYNVYMHDTNHRELFANTDRALSSGCIRLSRPKDMAVYILNNTKDEWDEKRVDNIIKTSKNYTVMIKRDIMVHLLYWTAFVDDNGVVNFRTDIYDRDDAVWKALLQDPPSL